MSERRTIWAAARRSRLLLAVALVTLIAAPLVACAGFGDVLRALQRFAGPHDMDGGVLGLSRAFDDYVIAWLLKWIGPIFLTVVSALYLGLRVFVKRDTL